MNVFHIIRTCGGKLYYLCRERNARVLKEEPTRAISFLTAEEGERYLQECFKQWKTHPNIKGEWGVYMRVGNLAAISTGEPNITT